MGHRFEAFRDLPGELQDAVWQASRCSPGVHIFKLGRGPRSSDSNPWPTSILSPRNDLRLEPPAPPYYDTWECTWAGENNLSAYVVTNRVRQACQRSRDAIDRESELVNQSPWGSFNVPCHPATRLIFNKSQDTIHLQTGCPIRPSTTEWFDPSVIAGAGPLANVILGSAFPRLRDIKHLALPWHENWPRGNPGLCTMTQIVRDKSFLWAPAHFPALETVYLVDYDSIRLFGNTPDPAARVFAGDRCRFVEVLPTDPAWYCAGPALAAAAAYQADYLTPSDARNWLWGLPMSRDLPRGSGYCHPGLRDRDLPDFWVGATHRQQVVYKVLVCIQD